MKRFQGQVTIFLALSCLSLFALLGVCLEGARSACLDYWCRQAADSALRSVFAAYQGDALRDYGLLLSKGREEGNSLTGKEALRYAEKYLRPGQNTLYAQGDRIRLQELEAWEEDVVYMTEGQGGVFIQAVETYMKTAGISLVLQSVLERLGLYNQEDGSGLLETIHQMISEKDSSLEGILNSYKDIKEQAAALQEEAKKKAEEEESLYIPPPGSSEDVKTDLLEQIKSIRKYGLISIITGQEALSAYSWDKNDLPTRLPQSEKDLHMSYGRGPINLLDHLLLGEYVQHKMNCYTQEAEGGSSYEWEYILSGRSSDKKALEAVIGEILLIRMGFNLAYLSTDAEKVALAELTAIGIMSFLALPQLIVVLKWILLSAWALAESIVDLRGLVRGRKIPLWKSSGSWRLSTMKLDLSAEGGGSQGLAYEDYLRILFVLGDPSRQAYRMMDVIQERMRKKDPSFTLKDYMVQAKLSFRMTASYLYADLPLIRDIVAPHGSRQYYIQSRYGYERR